LRQGMPDPDVVARTLSHSQSRLQQAKERAAASRARRQSAEQAVGALRPRWERAQRERERQQELLAELRVAEGQQAGLDRDRQRLERELGEIASARAERARLEHELSSYTELFAESQRLEVLAREEGRRLALLETQHALADDLRKLAERRSKIDSAPKLEEEVERALAQKRVELEEVDGKLEARRTEWVRDRQEAETKRQALRDQYTELKQQREQLAAAGEDGVCPTCTRPLGHSLRSVLELLDSQIETVRVDGNYFKARVEQLMEMPDDLQQLDERRRAVVQEVATLERRLFKVQLAVGELAQITSELGTKETRHVAIVRDLEAIPPGYDATRHQTVRSELDRLSPLDARAARLSAQIEREPLLLRERENVLEALGQLVRQVADLQSRREESQMPEAEFLELRSTYDRAAEEFRGAELALVSAEGEVRSAEHALASAQTAAQELAQRQRALAELNTHKRLHDELDRAYTDLRTDLNFQLRPELSELASAFLSEITDGRYAELELDDQYNIIVLEDSVPKPVISGGEEDLSNLVLRLAISQMIAERAGQPFSLLILDEIFGSLDELRRASVVDLLRHLQDRFEQVILITHIESVRDGLDNVISVRYDEQRGASVVEQQDAQLELPEADESGAGLLEGAGAAD
jgi:exonuclease SbcC